MVNGRIRGRLRAMSTLFAFLHHVAAFTLVSALAVELVLIRQELTLANARKRPVVDAVLGGSATLLLIIGLLRVFYFEKGSAYYFSSHAFLTKLAVFIIVAILSIMPTVEFLSWRKALKAGTGAGRGAAKNEARSLADPRRIGGCGHYPARCRHHGARRLALTSRSSPTASLSMRRLSLRPLPSVGEGRSAVQHNGLGEGEGCNPSPNRVC